MTLDRSVIFEAKQTNAEKQAAIRRGEIPAADRWQIVQQFAVCETAESCLYLCGDGTEEGTEVLRIERHQVEALIPQLRAGWELLDKDVAAYALQPEEPAATAAMGTAPEALPSLSVVARGVVEFSNHREFKERALAAIAAVNRNLQTDDDFATAELTVKAFRAGEDGLEAARAQILGQMASVSEVMETIDTVQAELRRVRLDLEKLVKTEKERRKADLVRRFMDEVRAHYDATNASLGEYRMPVPAGLSSELAASIKGKKSLSSMSDALSATAARIKIAAGLEAERIRACAAVIAEHAEHAALFPDRVQLVATKQPEDLRNLAKARVSDHLEREAARMEAERERIRREEAARIERERREEAARNAPEPAAQPAQPAQPAASREVEERIITLGRINGAIFPLSVTGTGLAALGFTLVGDGYPEKDLPAIFRAITNRLHSAYKILTSEGN